MAATNGYRSVTVGRVEIRSQISLGVILQTVVLIVAMVAFAIRTESRVGDVEARFDRQQSHVESELINARARIGLLEVANARTEQKFENILDLLERIEKRLDTTK